MEALEVFVSYRHEDRRVVETLSTLLLRRKLEVFLDQWNLAPGDMLQSSVEKALQRCSALLLCVGADGLSDWQLMEARTVIARRLQGEAVRIVPLFMPGSASDSESLPPFIRDNLGVTLSAQLREREIDRIIAGIRGVAGGPAPRSTAKKAKGALARTPYLGLVNFTSEDQEIFFGREEESRAITNRILGIGKPLLRGRLLGILGPSGSGKSSLLHAGVIPQFAGNCSSAGEWIVLRLHPGKAALQALDQTIAAAQLVVRCTDGPQREDESVVAEGLQYGGARVLLVVDQFEEIFTLTSSADERRKFVDRLVQLATAVHGNTFVLIGMRADFYVNCAQLLDFAALLEPNHMLLSPLSADGLSDAITSPARLCGAEIDSKLLEHLVKQMSGHPGALPLLQHTLLEMWVHRRGRRITLKTYNSVGGLAGAVDARAEAIYRALSDHEQRLCKQLMLGLVRVGDDGTTTKRRMTLAEIGALSSDPTSSAVATIINQLAAPDCRLVTTSGTPDDDTWWVELSHEVLVEAWNRYSQWISDHRTELKTLQRIRIAVAEWHNESHRDSALLRGSTLALARDIIAAGTLALTTDELGFIRRSAAVEDRDSRLSDAAMLDQLEAMAPNAWRSRPALEDWLQRATALMESQKRYPPEASDRAGADGEPTFEIATRKRLAERLRLFSEGLLFAARHRMETWDLDALDVDGPRAALELIGHDPISGLPEFAHKPSGRVPARAADGTLQLDDYSAIVLVLLPYGSYAMGAQATCPDGPNYDPAAEAAESPVNSVTLAPFLIGKHPLAQGQFLRLTGFNPSMYKPLPSGIASLVNPVECLSWQEADAALVLGGLTLPTEAQWEYAARAGTTMPWWTGPTPESLIGIGCLSRPTHQPVNRPTRQNQFGLVDVLGNVWEWCADDSDDYNLAPIDLTGRRRPHDPHSFKVSRGASFFNDAAFARVSLRYFRTPQEARFNNRGCRAAGNVGQHLIEKARS